MAGRGGAYSEYGGGEVSNRAALFGSERRPGREERLMMQEGMRDVLWEENNEKIRSLQGRVDTLRDISIEIGTEVRSQTVLLDGMTREMHSADSQLTRVMRGISSLMHSSRGNTLCHVMIFVLVIVLILWIKRSLPF